MTEIDKLADAARTVIENGQANFVTPPDRGCGCAGCNLVAALAAYDAAAPVREAEREVWEVAQDIAVIVADAEPEAYARMYYPLRVKLDELLVVVSRASRLLAARAARGEGT